MKRQFRIIFDRWIIVCGIFDVDPIISLRDPVRALRFVASAGETAIESFLQLALIDPPALEDFSDEDEARLFAAGCFATIAAEERRNHRARSLHHTEYRRPNAEAPVGTPHRGPSLRRVAR